MSNIRDYIEAATESQNLEYKAAFKWTGTRDHLHMQVVRTCMAMANLQDGGAIVIGVKQDRQNGKFISEGVTSEIAASFNDDDIQAFVNAYCDPYVELSLSREIHEDRQYVVIEVKSFEELPIICKDGAQGLRCGDVYIRSRRMPETRLIQTQAEMRDLIDLAVDRSGAKLRSRCAELRKLVAMEETLTTDGDTKEFALQRGAL